MKWFLNCFNVGICCCVDAIHSVLLCVRSIHFFFLSIMCISFALRYTTHNNKSVEFSHCVNTAHHPVVIHSSTHIWTVTLKPKAYSSIYAVRRWSIIHARLHLLFTSLFLASFSICFVVCASFNWFQSVCVCFFLVVGFIYFDCSIFIWSFPPRVASNHISWFVCQRE